MEHLMQILGVVVLSLLALCALGPLFWLAIREHRKAAKPKFMWTRWRFDPASDMTTFELATILSRANVIEGVYFPADVTAEQWFSEETGVPNLGRHFWRTDHIEEGPPYEAKH